MKQLFILGAGFSKAISPKMPTLWELSAGAVKPETLPAWPSRYNGLCEDVEQLLTYLHQEMPWKAPEEVHLDKARFTLVARAIGDYIKRSQEQVLSGPIPKWAFDFAKYLHRQKAVVGTLNYDTLLESLSSTVNLGPLDKQTVQYVFDKYLYRLPIADLMSREAMALFGPTPETYRLLKLHGSVNWYFSGETDTITGPQVYYERSTRFVPVYEEANRKTFRVQKEVQRSDGRVGQQTVQVWESPKSYELDPDAQKYADERERLKLDLSPLIIPPVADKSTFYKTRLVKVLWSEFRKAAEEADELFCVGYSLPKTDLTMRLFLRATFEAANKRVCIVDRENREKERHILVENYADVFRGCDLDETYLGMPDAVERMVLDLCKREQAPLEVSDSNISS